MMEAKAEVLRQQIERCVRAQTGETPAQKIEQWLRSHSYFLLADKFDINKYEHLKKVERLIVNEFCPRLIPFS